MLADKPLLDLGSTPAQDVAIGISVRNALMHFKPQSVHLPFAETRVSTKGDWDRLCRKLAGRPIKPNPFSNSRQPDFPFRLLSHDCAAWLLQSARAFVRMFAEHMGLQRLPGEQNLIEVYQR